MTSSTLDWNTNAGSNRATCSKADGERHAGPMPAACMPPAAQIAPTTSAIVANPIASPRRKVSSGATPVRPMLASERRSTPRTHASTSSKVGAKPIHNSACKPARPTGSPPGVDQPRACIQPSIATTGTALNSTSRIGANQIHGSQPRAGSRENKATRVMHGSGLARGAPTSRRRSVAATALRRNAQ